MYSAKEGAEASVGIELPKTEGHVAVYSEAGKSIVALEEDKTGVVLQALSGPLSTFKVIGLHRVAGSDILVGSVDATTKAHVKMAPLVESNGHKEHTSAAVNGHDEDATPAPPIRSESASSEEGDAESEANEDDPAATDPVQDPSPSSVVAVVLRFFANFWQALLALCGVQSAHGKAGLDDDAVDEADVNGEEAPVSHLCSRLRSASLLMPDCELIHDPSNLSSPDRANPTPLALRLRPLPPLHHYHPRAFVTRTRQAAPRQNPGRRSRPPDSLCARDPL